MAVLLQIRGAHKSYGDQVLLDDAEATLTDDVKVGFVGRNGAGKSTLLRLLLGEEELDAGEVLRHPRLKIGYLRQHDPFLPGDHLPGPADVSPDVVLDQPLHGGHVGFLRHGSGMRHAAGRIDWMPARILRFFDEVLGRAPQPDSTAEPTHG